MVQLSILMEHTKNFWIQKKLNMNGYLFFSLFIVLAGLFLKREKIVDFLDYNLNIKIKSKFLVYIIVICFAMLLTSGMLFNNTKEKYSNISKNYDGLKPSQDKNKPHRYFDINTYD